MWLVQNMVTYVTTRLKFHLRYLIPTLKQIKEDANIVKEF